MRKSMNKKTLLDILQEGEKEIAEGKGFSTEEVLQEGSVPQYSVWGAIEKYVLPEWIDLIKKFGPKPKYIKNYKLSHRGSTGFWIYSFEGYTRTDLTFNGSIVIAAPEGKTSRWTIEVDAEDGWGGGVKREWEFRNSEDYTNIFKSVGASLKDGVGE